MSFGSGIKMARVDSADPATPDTIVQTNAGASWDGVIEKTNAVNGLSEMKAESPRQAFGTFALEQMERLFDVVENVFHRSGPKDIL